MDSPYGVGSQLNHWPAPSFSTSFSRASYSYSLSYFNFSYSYFFFSHSSFFFNVELK
jgi:hypothetical protein